MKKLYMLRSAAGMMLLISALSSLALADPCLVVYPSGRCIYRFDPAEYYTVGPGSPYYDPAFDRGGKVLLEIGSNGIDHSIYQAPGIIGFEMSTDGLDGYFFTGSEYDLVIDGFAGSPTTYVNIVLTFDRIQPSGCIPKIWIDGQMIAGTKYAAGDLVVSTPTMDGNNYSDTKTLHIDWEGCIAVRAWAFADDNYNGIHDGGECFTAFSHDITVPVDETSWGAVKSLYR